MEDAIRQIEMLCQEKLLVYQNLLKLFRTERKAIIQADVTKLWAFSREKKELADKILELKRTIYIHAIESELINEEDQSNYSLIKIIAALPTREKGTLVNLNMALNEMKRKIAALSHENRVYLEESLKTIEDLVGIITRSYVREERYGRETYMRPSSYGRMAVMREGV
jgi:hypothetical protein